MDFDSMTVPQLKDIARANNLKNWSKLKKADLIQFLIDNVPGGARGGRPLRQTSDPVTPAQESIAEPGPEPKTEVARETEEEAM